MMRIAILGATSRIVRDLIISFLGVVKSVPLADMAKLPHGVPGERIKHS